jgi:hypothetical protein
MQTVIITGAAARALMAPYLGNAEVELALDSPCADEPGKVWLVATLSGLVAGWSAAVPDGDQLKRRAEEDEIEETPTPFWEQHDARPPKAGREGRTRNP